MNKSFWALCVGAMLVLILTTGVWFASWHKAKQSSDVLGEPLGIPRGSIRAMLGILIVGSFVDFLLFAWPAFKGNQELFTTVISSFATLTGAVTGFYFGHRTAQGSSSSGASTTCHQPGRAEAGDDDAHQGITGGAQQNQQ